MKKAILLLLAAFVYFSAAQAQMTTRVIKNNLFIPWEIIYGPDDHIWFTQKNGFICRMNPADGHTDTLYHESATAIRGEGGMLGMALHPDFSNQPYVYIVYNYISGADYKERLVRYTYTSGLLASPTILLDNIDASNIHNGSRLLIVNNYIYMSTGDAATASSAQDPASINGKVLRLNLDGTVPSDNPVNTGAAWSLGHRNIQGMVYANNRIYVSEHGANSDDEINIISKGRNYGWPEIEGYCNTPDEITFCNNNNIAEPIEAWTPTLAVCGIDYYDHPMFPSLQKSLLMTTLKQQRLYQLSLNSAGDDVTTVTQIPNFNFGRLRDVCISPEGRIYISTSNSTGNGSTFADRIIEIYDPSYTSVATVKTLQDIAIYPTPAYNEIHIKGNTARYGTLNYAVMNTQGQLLMTGQLNAGETTLAITALPYGEYLIRFRDKNGVIATRKIIKQ